MERIFIAGCSRASSGIPSLPMNGKGLILRIRETAAGWDATETSRENVVLTIVVITTNMTWDEGSSPVREQTAHRFDGGGGISRAAAHHGHAFPGHRASAQGRGPFRDAVQRAANPARRAGRADVRGNRQSHDYAGPGHHPPARPPGEARPDRTLPGDEGPAHGADPDHP